MNKNQLRFFELALGYFGSSANNVKLKDLKEFATKNNIILPGSYLQKKCKVSRGRFDLTKSGIKPIKSTPSEIDLSSFQSPIEDMSITADPPKKPKKQKKKVPENPKAKYFNNPVFVVQNFEQGDVWSCHDNFKSAWESRKIVLHDGGDKTEQIAKKELELKGATLIKSKGAHLFCLISKYELNNNS